MAAQLGSWTLPAQETTTEPAATSEPFRTVEVQPRTSDTAIASRLTAILEATGWFLNAETTVEEGVVFLDGQTTDLKHKEWAGRLAANTRDVVAVVNRISVVDGEVWDLSPAWEELRNLGTESLRSLPLVAIGLLLLSLTWLATKASARVSSSLLGRRAMSPLLRSVASRAIAVPVFLLGLYLVLRVSGLTRLAVTVLGGTGLLGLVIGFAFRDIAENFLASILLSIQRPFNKGDLIEVAGFTGYVQSVNTRSTLLMTQEGNHVQIPNATIYKKTITNLTANPKTRCEFGVGIGYDDSISHAQSVALQVLKVHPAVLDDPESLVLVDNLAAATVNLRVLFWMDIAKHDRHKVRSAIIRLTKRAFDHEGISMPDEAREVVFPSGVPVRMIQQDKLVDSVTHEAAPRPDEDHQAASESEGGLDSEADDIAKQARSSRTPEGGQNLLEN